MTSTRRLALALAALTFSCTALAQAWAPKPIRIVVPLPPGGAPERFAALIRDEIPRWGEVARESGAKID